MAAGISSGHLHRDSGQKGKKRNSLSLPMIGIRRRPGYGGTSPSRRLLSPINENGGAYWGAAIEGLRV